MELVSKIFIVLIMFGVPALMLRSTFSYMDREGEKFMLRHRKSSETKV